MTKEAQQQLDWDAYDPELEGNFPNLNDELKQVGDSAVIKFLTDGKEVSKEQMHKILEKRGKNTSYARAMAVLTAKNQEGEKRNVWHSLRDIRTMQELAAFRKKNGGSLVGFRTRITRVGLGREVQNWKYESA